jgi:hypothetical protein
MGPESAPEARRVAPDPSHPHTAIGATVYYRVFDLSDGDPDDPWGTGFKRLTDILVPGSASRGRGSDKLDTAARYLYLYQVINDSGRPAQIKNTAVRLLVPPHLVTSWGHFAFKKGDAIRGIGFAMEFDLRDAKTPKAKTVMLPVSAEHPGVVDHIYRNPAPYFLAPHGYGMASILIDNAPRPIAEALDAEDRGRAPEKVLLQTMANFEGAPNWLERDQVQVHTLLPYEQLTTPFSGLYNPYYTPLNPLIPSPCSPVVAQGSALGGLTTGVSTSSLAPEALWRAPAVVAYWSDETLLPGQRSTLFGFTSNYPPVYEDVRLWGNPAPPVVPPASCCCLRAVLPVIDGEVPTPAAFEGGLPLASGGPSVGALSGPLAGIGAGGGLLQSGGFGGFGGLGAGLGGGGLGGGTGGGNGSGNGNNQQAQNQNTTPSIPFPAPPTPSTQNATATVSQNQPQPQAQAQAQLQGQLQAQLQGQLQAPLHIPAPRPNQDNNQNVVPEPAAFVPALLALPVLWLLIRRHLRLSTAAT